MNEKTEWKEIPGMNIQSDRDTVTGEKICAFVIDPQTDKILENNIFTPNENEAGQYTWPKKLAEKINANSINIRAGEMDENGNITPIGSQYRNKLWAKESSDLIVYPTNCFLDSWKSDGAISSEGAVIPGIKIKISVNSLNCNLLYEELTFITDNNTSSRYCWPYYLSDHINKNSLFLRAGEKNIETKKITPLQSSYRNEVWVPNGNNYTYEIKYEASDNIIHDAETVYNNTLAMLTAAQPPSKEEIDGWLNGFSQGKFSDISYPGTNAGNNTSPLYDHLNRTKYIANYIHYNPVPENDFYYTSAVEAINFYTNQDFKTSNWWDRQIGLAKIVSETLIILTEKHLPPPLNESISYLKRTTNTSMGQTGANQADFAYIQLLWSMSGWRNEGLISFLNEAYAASDSISSLCLPVTRHGKEDGEGISVDNSFSQHNPQSGKYSQLYAGSYGAVLLGNIFKTQSVLYGVFSLNKAAIRSLEDFIINGMGWFSYSRLYDFQVCGRAISRGMNGSNALAGWCRQLMNTTPEHPEMLQELIRRADGDEGSNDYYLGCRAYWVNDYLAKISRKYCLWAKVISSRTVGGESGNGENLKGYYMGSGSHFIIRTGNEYRNIQPLWEWQRIPGTTVEQVDNFIYPLIDWGSNNWGSDDFAGVISNGEAGIASMILTRKNVKNAKKSVIMLPGKDIFAGSSIDNSSANNPVYTSVNQCNLNGDVDVYFNDGTQKLITLGGKITSDKIVEVIHDGFSYCFPTPQVITVQVGTQTGSWRDINKNGSNEIISGEIFSVWIEHEKGNATSYYYEITSTEGETPAQKTQAIYDNLAHVITGDDKKSVAAVIFTNNGYDIVLSNVKFKVMNSLAVIASVREDGILEITIADLTQKMEKADLLFTWGDVTSLTSFPLPEGDNKGESITYLVSPVTKYER